MRSVFIIIIIIVEINRSQIRSKTKVSSTKGDYSESDGEETRERALIKLVFDGGRNFTNLGSAWDANHLFKDFSDRKIPIDCLFAAVCCECENLSRARERKRGVDSRF